MKINFYLKTRILDSTQSQNANEFFTREKTLKFEKLLNSNIQKINSQRVRHFFNN